MVRKKRARASRPKRTSAMKRPVHKVAKKAVHRARARRPTSKPAARRRTAPTRRAPADLLAVDIGNSETVAGVFRGNELRESWRLSSHRMTADEARLQLEAMIRSHAENEGEDAVRPARAVFCSVAPTLSAAWAEALTRMTGRAPLEMNAATVTDLRIRYHDRDAVGADRVANAIAVRAVYGTPAIVVDLGTATTFDCISESGTYLGGVIAPGVGTSLEQLHLRAARLPRIELRRPERAIGRTTEESIRAGAMWGTAGQVDALVRRLALEMKGTPHVIATGGLATVIAPECETINRVDEGLTLKGLRLFWESRQ